MDDSLPFDSLGQFRMTSGATGHFAAIKALEDNGLCQIENLPYTIRILLESALRMCDGHLIKEED